MTAGTQSTMAPEMEAAFALHRFGLGPRAGSIAAIASDSRGALITDLNSTDNRTRRRRALDDERRSRARGVRVSSAARRATRSAARARCRAAAEWRCRGEPHQRSGEWGSAEPGRSKRSRNEPAQCGARERRRAGAAADLSRGGQGPRRRARSTPRSALSSGSRGSGRIISAVSADKAGVRPLVGAYEREAIRPHVLGRFGDMLIAVETPSGDADLSRQCAIDRPRIPWPAATAARASTKISLAKSSNCTHSACALSTPKTT